MVKNNTANTRYLEGRFLGRPEEGLNFVVLNPTEFFMQWRSIVFSRDRNKSKALLNDVFWTAFVIDGLDVRKVMDLCIAKGFHPFKFISQCEREYDKRKEMER